MLDTDFQTHSSMTAARSLEDETGVKVIDYQRGYYLPLGVEGSTLGAKATFVYPECGCVASAPPGLAKKEGGLCASCHPASQPETLLEAQALMPGGVLVLRFLERGFSPTGHRSPPLLHVVRACGSFMVVNVWALADGAVCRECETFEDCLCEVG